MAPKVSGSSTIGVKKSTVCTRASSAVRLYTPASSAVSNPIRTFSSAQRGTVASTWSKTFGLSLEAQPAAFTCAVSFLSEVPSIVWGRAFTVRGRASTVRARIYYNSGDATHVSILRRPFAGAGVYAGVSGTTNRPAIEESIACVRARRLDPGPPGRVAGRNRVSAWLPAGAGDPGQLQRDLHRNRPRREKGLGLLPQDGAGGSLAAHRAGVSRRAGGHCRRPEGARRKPGYLGHRRHERVAGAALLR